MTTRQQVNVPQSFPASVASHEIKGKTVRGGAATIVGQFGKFALQIASTMVLARMLTPADFGLVGMVAAITGFLALLKDAGLSAATVQCEVITHEQVSALFWINVGLGCVLAGCTAALAPILVGFYGEPRLLGITLVLAASFVVSALTVQHQALMRRQMRFKALALIDVVSMAGGITAAIVMAYCGFGYWSLVGMPITNIVVNLIALWTVQSWRPGRFRRGCGIGGLLRFGGYLTCDNILNYLFRNTDNVLIGWYWGAGPLGLYSKAYALLLLPITQVNRPISSVAISTLSRIQSDAERVRRYFVGGYSVVASIVFPIIIVTAVFAEEVVHVLLGDQWLGAVSLFRYLAPATLVGALASPLGWVLWARGRADQLLRISVFWTVMIVIGFAAGLRYGVEGVAIGYSIMSCIAVFPTCVMLIKGTPIRMADIAQAIKHPLLAGCVAGLSGLAFKLAGPADVPMIVRALAGGTLVVSVYAFLLLVIMRKWSFWRDLLGQLKLSQVR